jgi:hypothetical protein
MIMSDSGFLNCYELDEWFNEAEDRAYASDDLIDDDSDIREYYYPETLPK